MAFYMDSKRIPPEQLVDRPPQQYDRILQTYDIDGARSKIKKFDPESHNYSLKTNDIEGAQPKKKIRNIYGSYNYNPIDSLNNQYQQQQQQQQPPQIAQYDNQIPNQQNIRYQERPQDQIQQQGLMQNQGYQQQQQYIPQEQQQQYNQSNQLYNNGDFQQNQQQQQVQNDQQQYQKNYEQFYRGYTPNPEPTKNYIKSQEMLQRGQSNRQSQPNLAKYGQNLIQQNNYQQQQPLQQDYNQQQQQFNQIQQNQQPQQNQEYIQQQQQQNSQRPNSNNIQQQNQQPKTWDKHKYNLIGGYIEDKRIERRDQSSALEKQYYENYNSEMANELRKTQPGYRSQIYNGNVPQVKIDKRLLDYNSPQEVEQAQQNLRKYQFNNNIGQSGFYNEFQLKKPIASHSKQFIGNTVPQNQYPDKPQRYGPNAQQTLPNNLLD
ncbi:hypothetical protein PPERSA_08420 [Pseudocohnilembus persalinus]|uniref:Uncharacterized protein n=1 Tax=Pseudocohnilembus persalinus TaxID=266149 RepID=A0A0V0R699_PSEPJ|nr:hypothetical protein PPERSA_08420 [Pseudocohnilembus persalinus]|eukprot:KRX10017.1 hypothetical protein PPERSA_08420 [Pseudocohnilembus persalinus]